MPAYWLLISFAAYRALLQAHQPAVLLGEDRTWRQPLRDTTIAPRTVLEHIWVRSGHRARALIPVLLRLRFDTEFTKFTQQFRREFG